MSSTLREHCGQRPEAGNSPWPSVLPLCFNRRTPTLKQELNEREVELLLMDVLVAVDVDCAEVVFDLFEHVALGRA